MKNILKLLLFLLIPSLMMAGEKVGCDDLLSQYRDNAYESIEVRSGLAIELGDCFLLNNKDSAKLFYEEAIKLASQSSDNLLKGKTHQKIAIWNKTNGFYNDGIEACVSSLGFYNQSNEIEGVIEVTTLLGHLYALREERVKAVEFYDKAITLCKENQKILLLYPAYTGKGNCLYFQDDLEGASILFEKAITISEKFNSNTDASAGMYANTGNIYLTLKEYPKAIEKYKKGFEIYFEANNKYGMSLLSYNIGDAYLGLNQYDSSLRYFNINLFLAKDLNSQEEMKYAYLGLSNHFEQKGDFENAYLNYLLHAEYKDSLNETQYSADVDQLIDEYQNEKQKEVLKSAQNDLDSARLLERQSNRLIWVLSVAAILLIISVFAFYRAYMKSRKANKLIVKQSNEITKKSDAMDKTLKQKDILLKEVHHRVKNNLQIIASLLNLQKNKIDNTEAKKAILNSQTRVQTIALIHRKLYQNELYDKVGTATYIQDLIDNYESLFASNGRKVVFKTSLDEIYLSIDDAVPLGLIISELISNSIKHAFDNLDEQAIIYIDFLDVSKNVFELTYSDNGSGVGNDFSLENPESLGLEIITALAEQLSSEVKIIETEPLKVGLQIKK